MNKKSTEILRALVTADGEYVSGETIGQALGISRAGVARHIANLKADGFKIESNTRRGHRLNQMTDILTEDAVGLFTDVPCRVVSETDSTFRETEGLREETVVAAVRQTMGRGRRQRSFSCEAGGAYFNYVCKPDLPASLANLITLAAGVAVSDTCKNCGAEVKLKYPNDGYIGGKKLCGIMTECVMNADEIVAASIGIGINFTNTLPADLIETAARLADFAQRPVFRAELIGKTVERIRQLLENPETIVPLYREKEYLAGQRVVLKTDTGETEAEYLGVDEEGYMQASVTGKAVRVTIGEVTVRPAGGKL